MLRSRPDFASGVVRTPSPEAGHGHDAAAPQQLAGGEPVPLMGELAQLRIFRIRVQGGLHTESLGPYLQRILPTTRLSPDWTSTRSNRPSATATQHQEVGLSTMPGCE
jgi:hypothetical protein